MDKCEYCKYSYKHESYSTITNVHKIKYRCKLIGHKEIKYLTEQDKQKCHYEIKQ